MRRVRITTRTDGKQAQEVTVNQSDQIYDSVMRVLNKSDPCAFPVFDIKVKRGGRTRNKIKNVLGSTFGATDVRDGDMLLVVPRAPTRDEEKQLITVRNVFKEMAVSPSTIENCEEDIKSIKYSMSDLQPLKDEVLGQGGFGQVYRAKIKKTGKVVAVKEVMGTWTNRDPAEQKKHEERFMREVVIMATIRHPAVFNIIGYTPFEFSETNRPALLMEAMPRSLQDMINLEEKGMAGDWDLSAKHIALYGIAAGMAFLHNHRIIHRDLKPGNVLLDDDYLPHITDFGLAKFVPQGRSREQSTIDGTVIYQAPEIWMDDSFSRKVDVYAFGVLMYAVLAGTSPFAKSTNQWRHMQNVGKGERPALDMVPVEYHELIKLCWEQNPDQRPSFDQIVKELGHRAYLKNVDVDKFKDYQAKVVPEKLVRSTERKVAFQSIEIRAASRVGQRSSVRELTKSAEGGSADASYRLAQKYRDGDNVEKDEKLAFKWFIDSFEKGLVRACVDIGECYHHGRGVSCNMNQAIKYYRIGVENKCPEAMYNLGMCYWFGSGVARNYIEAFKLFKAASAPEFRFGEAESMYGESLNFGKGCKVDEKAALEYYKRASDHGSLKGMHEYASMLLHGKSITQNVAEACDIFWIAARRGFHDSYYPLYQVYSRGYGGVSRNIELAMVAAYEGAKKDNMRAMIAYADLVEEGYTMGETKEEARKMKARALSIEFRQQQNNFAVDLAQGEGCFQSYEEAFKMLRTAANNKSTRALLNISHYYQHGTGCQQDINEAENCCREALRLGDPEAYEPLARILLEKNQFDEALKLAKIAADKQYVDAYVIVGRMYMKGQGCSKNQTMGFQYYERGAKSDDPNGLYKAGCCLLKGKGTAKDISRARNYLERARDEGASLVSSKARAKLDGI